MEFMRPSPTLCLSLLILGTALGGCKGSPLAARPTPSQPESPIDPWVIESRDPKAKIPAYLGNGSFGIRIGADGLNAVPKGVLTYAFPPHDLLFLEAKDVPPLSAPDPADAADYRQTLDLRNGVLTTRYAGVENRLRLSPRGYGISREGLGWPREHQPPKRDPQIENAADRFWQDFWKIDIEIDGPAEDQQAIRSFLFYLRSSISPNSPYAPGPYGLSAANYGGHVFWDADMWMFPALSLLDPERARTITAYRLRQQIQYERNAGGKGLRVPWESSATGREVAPHMASEEIHVTGSACFALDCAAALGLEDSSKVADFCDKADRYYRATAKKAPDGVLELRNVGSVDESHTVHNDLYTNLLAQWLANGRTWKRGAVRYRIAKDARSLQSYSDDEDRAHKQAAAVLSVFPLQYPEAEEQALRLIDRYAPITIKQGPAMTDAIEATILARAGEAERAYGQWQSGWRDFVKPPFLLFSEHRATRETYFLTGAAGCLQTVLYGFVGFRIDSHADVHAAWSMPLRQGKWLSAAPHLPKAWKQVRIKGLHVLGKSYTVTVTPRGVSVT